MRDARRLQCSITFNMASEETQVVKRNKDSPSFLSLPGEVRNAIYALLFPDPGSTLSLGKQYDFKTCYIFRSTPYDHTALFLTCHQIRHEASSLFYPCNTFSISRPTQLTLYIRDLTPHTRDQLSHLSISLALSLSSLSRRRRAKSLASTDFPPKGRNANAILTQNRDLRHLSRFTALKLLILSLNIEACDHQRYLAPSHITFLDDLVPRNAEIRLEVAKCAHCLHWHDSTSNPMAMDDVERNQQWWRWQSPPLCLSPRSSPYGIDKWPESGGGGREWILTRRIGGKVVDIQPFPPTNHGPDSPNLIQHSTEEQNTHLVELLSQCYTCKKPLATTRTTLTAEKQNPNSKPNQQAQGHVQAQTCEVCALVSFCSNLCFAACVEHQHLCVPKPFG